MDFYPKNFDPAIYLGADGGIPDDGSSWADWVKGKQPKFPEHLALAQWWVFCDVLESFCDCGGGWPEKYWGESPEVISLFRKDLTKSFNFVGNVLGENGLKESPFRLESKIGDEKYIPTMCAYAIMQIDEGISGLLEDDPSRAAAGFSFAMFAKICVMESILWERRGHERTMFHSEFAKRAARARVESDPKQAEKSFVYDCWLDWQKKPDNYKTKAAFAKDMLTKCENLDSQKVIEDWCRAWEKSSKSAG